MVPPRYVTIGLSLPKSPTEDVQIPPGTWVSSQGKVLHGKSGRVFRTKQRNVFSAGAPVSLVQAIEIISPSDKRRSFEAMESQNKNDAGGVVSNLEVKLVLNNAKVKIPSDYAGDLSKVELKTGILLPWEDQGTQRIANLYAITSEVESLKAGDELDAYVFDFIRTKDSFLKMEQNVYRSSLTEFPQLEGIEISSLDDGYSAYGAADEEIGSFVTAPGPHRDSTSGFLPLSLAISFFFMWAISGTGQPSNMVRLMAFKDTMTLRRSIFTVAMYYTMIYFPLVIIFCCARILLPGMEAEADRIMPQMAVTLTTNVGMGWLAGLLIAAPFAAVMSTVDSFLLMISSALVRDIYQRNMNPDATEKQIKKLSYIFTLVVGLGALIGAMNPPEFLQDIIVYTGSGLAAAFLAPVVYALYWPRSNHQGCIAAMIGGFGAHLSLYIIGFINGEGFTPYRPLELDPIIIGLFGSFIIGFIVTLKTAPPSDKVVKKYFYKKLEG